MTNLEPELEELKRSLLEMMALVSSQLRKCKEATINTDVDLAREIVYTDKLVNAMELKIDKDCENILALYNPVATDLRFVLAALKINNDLERIGDNAESIANLLSMVVEKTSSELINSYKLHEMFDIAISMMEDVEEAMENEDSKLARKIFKKDEFLNKNNVAAPDIALNLIQKHPSDAKIILCLFSIIRKLERTGDLAKNLGEEIIFYIEAKVLKHRKEQKKLKKELKNKAQ